MLVIKKKDKQEPATFKHTFRGEEIELTVRPFDEKEIMAMRQKFTRYDFQENPRTRQLDRVAIVDNEKFGRALFDHLLVSFAGIGESADTPLEVTLDNKLLLIGLEPGEGEKPLAEVIQEKARELASVIEVERNEQEKK